jgi:outer membrane protein OmpA-like peptidoglycan-associated protein
MRNFSRFVIAAALAILPATASAQRQGAVEIGALGRFTKFADTVGLDAGFGAGGRAGIYVLRNVMLEMDLSYGDMNVTNLIHDSLNNVSHTLWSYRLLWNAPMGDRLRLMLGGGYGYDSYGRVRSVAPRAGGPQALVGLRAVINDRVSARFEAIGQFNMPADSNTQPVPRATHLNIGAQAGISVGFFLNPPAPRIVRDTFRVVQRDTIYQTRIDTIRLAAPGGGGGAGSTVVDPVVIGAINFAFNKSDITPEAKLILDKIAESLTDAASASRTITVTGNTDAIGSERYNERLGQDRADQAKAYLVSKGVAESRITARTAGEGDPIAPNTTDNGRATNRRVLIMLTS